MRIRLALPKIACVTLCSFQLLGAVAQGQAGITRSFSQNVAVAAQPHVIGDFHCEQMDFDGKKTVCNYLPKKVSAHTLKSRILTYFYKDREPTDANMYVKVLKNDQLEFAHPDADKIKMIMDKISDFDVQDIFVPRRKVNIVIKVLQLIENADDSIGLVVGAKHASRRQDAYKPIDRTSIATNPAGLININFAFGNLVNNLLDIVLKNFKQRNDIKTVVDFPIQITHDYQLSSSQPISQTLYITPNSVAAYQETLGFKAEGNVRFHENDKFKVVIKNFNATYTDYEEGDNAERTLVGGMKYSSYLRDLELEIGCSTAIRLVGLSKISKEVKRNFGLKSSKQSVEATKDFLFIIKAESDSENTEPSPNCAETTVSAEKQAK
ncbi:MAG: hypothetical protein H7061_02075 [Bdellovibrionaceae bacterium]|nr:hypothetical protein [Bdellovibrio sp.]